MSSFGLLYPMEMFSFHYRRKKSVYISGLNVCCFTEWFQGEHPWPRPHKRTRPHTEHMPQRTRPYTEDTHTEDTHTQRGTPPEDTPTHRGRTVQPQPWGSSLPLSVSSTSSRKQKWNKSHLSIFWKCMRSGLYSLIVLKVKQNWVTRPFLQMSDELCNMSPLHQAFGNCHPRKCSSCLPREQVTFLLKTGLCLSFLQGALL